MKSQNYFITGLLLIVCNLSMAQTARSADVQEAIIDDELPVVGMRYYYYPNLDAYFDTHTNLYILKENGQWMRSKEMASGYRGYSLFNSIRVEITDYNGDEPFTKLKEHQEQFPKKYSSKRKPPKIVPQDSKNEDTNLAYN